MVKWYRYRPGVAQRVSRGIAVLLHVRGTRRGWGFSSTPRPHFTPGKDPVLILEEAVWAPGPVWTCWKSRPHRNSVSDRPTRSQSLYRLFFLPLAQDLLVGQGFLVIEASRWHSDTTHSVGLLWTRDQSVAETCTWQYTTLTRHRRARSRRDSNPQLQPASGRKPTP